MNHKPSGPEKRRHPIIRTLSLLSQTGITMAACVLIGVLLGNYLDQRLGTSPWLLLLLSLLGAAAALKSLFHLAKKN